MAFNNVTTPLTRETQSTYALSHVSNTDDTPESRTNTPTSLLRSEIQATVRESVLQKINRHLETELVDTREKLVNVEAALAAIEATLAAVTREKDQEIDWLKNRLHMENVVDRVLARPTNLSRAQDTVPHRARVVLGDHGDVRKELSPIYPKTKRKVDDTAEMSVTPKFKSRSPTSLFVHGLPDASTIISTRPTEQRSKEGDQASVYLSPSLRALDDDAFEKLLLGSVSEAPASRQAPSPPLASLQENERDESQDRSFKIKSEPSKDQGGTSGNTSQLDSPANLQLELPPSFLSSARRYRHPSYFAGATVTEFIPNTSKTADVFADALKDKPRTEPGSRKIHLCAPNDFAVKWKYRYKYDLFGDEKRYVKARNDMAQRSVHTNMFWRNGLRYTPENPSESNAFRTIMIEDVPIGSTSRQIQNLIIGGNLESFQLYNTRSITGSLTARIVYLYQEAAYDMIEYVRRLRLCGKGGLSINDKKLHVVHVTTEATTLPPTDLAVLIYEYGFTRVLRLTNLTPVQVVLLKQKFDDSVFVKELNGEGQDEGAKRATDVVLRSIRDADIWKMRLGRDKDFEGAELSIGEDPCNVRFEEIEIA